MDLLQEAQYQYWAEEKFFYLLKKVSQKNWADPLPGFTKSLQEIYIHKYEVMWSWFTMIFVNSSKKLGENPLGTPDFEPLTKDQFIIEAQKLFERLLQYIQTTEDSKLTLDVEWIKKPYEVTSHEIIYNILNHLSYHRGQTAFMFKKFGLEIPETDYNPYLYEIKKLNK